MKFHLSRFLLVNTVFLVWGNASFAGDPPTRKAYKLWYNKPAPILPIINQDSLNKKGLVEYTPVDQAWENWSLPIGNGYLGASLFGRTETERIQLTENSMAAKSLYGRVGLTSFAELFIDFKHSNPTNYSRSLSLNDAVSTVQYQHGGVVYKREYFASYPDKVLVIRLTSNQKGKLSFTLRSEIPYKKEFGAASNFNGRAGTVLAKGKVLTLSGKMEVLNLLFEGQFKVIPTGGSMKASNDAGNGKIEVLNANAATIIVAVGTNYKMDSNVFIEPNYAKKLAGYPSPHPKVSSILKNASAKSYTSLLANHKKDYTNLFNRASVDFAGKVSPLPTDQLLKKYKEGSNDTYLEELYFQYGRYLLICSSRPGTLPTNLQGIWTQYDISPWTSGYWHNINVQMNYWPVFNTNLTELFQSFVDYNAAYRNSAQKIATQYIQKNNPKMLSPDGDNGWAVGSGASAYGIGSPGGHSGPGTGNMTSKMLWDYYEFTGNKQILKDIAYPAVLGMSKFLSKVVVDTVGYLLTSPSYSPEQRANATKLHYQTIGSSFDQQMIYENHSNTLKAAEILGDKHPILPVLKAQLPRLDHINIGWSGQIKEYREEKYYGEIVDPKHRHISHLLALYPGSLINLSTPAWLDAAKETLVRRGDKSTGWGLAHRLNLWARVKDGDTAYLIYAIMLKTRTLDNLWNTHPPYQIDGNLGATGGVAELLLQSHEGFIDLLPALPQRWNTGSYNGLLARNNFEVSANWSNGLAQNFTIKSKNGGACKLKYFNIDKAVLKNASGKQVQILSKSRDFIEFKTLPGEVFVVSSIPAYSRVQNPSNLTIKESKDEKVSIRWDKSPNAVTYKVYAHFGASPDYKLVQSNTSSTAFDYIAPKTNEPAHYILKVTAVDKTGRESNGLRVNVEYK